MGDYSQMQDLVLSPGEVRDLTGYKHHKCQARILREWGIPFVIGRDGGPRVLRGHLRRIAGSPVVQREAEPNLKGLARR